MPTSYPEGSFQRRYVGMFKSRWVFAATLGIILAISSQVLSQSSEETEPNQETRTGGQSDNDQNPVSLGVPIRIIEDPVETERNRHQQQVTEQREVEDLAAQQSMAESTQQIVFLTWLQFTLGIVGTIALIYTLLLTRKSAVAAVRTAQSERAWIISAGFNHGPAINATLNGAKIANGFIVSPKWRNAGRSPGINAECYVSHALIGPGDEVPKFSANYDRSVLRQAAIGPNSEFSGVIRLLNDRERGDVFEGRTRMIIYSRVSYEDIFPDTPERHSEICVEVEINGMENINGEEQPRVAFMPVGSQNTIS